MCEVDRYETPRTALTTSTCFASLSLVTEILTSSRKATAKLRIRRGSWTGNFLTQQGNRQTLPTFPAHMSQTILSVNLV